MELIDDWLAHCDLLDRSVSTMKRYCQIADAVVRPELGHVWDTGTEPDVG